MEDVLAFEDATLGYRGQTVLHVPELRLAPGGVGVLHGPSGSGKSTVLRCAAGLAPALAGHVRYTGSRIAWVPQADRLDGLHPVNVDEVVLAGGGRLLSTFGRVSAEGRAAIDGTLDSLGLAGLSRRPFAELSGGQRQRVLIARAVLCGADLIILDEPTSALDDDAAALVLAAVRQLSQEGAAVLVVSHDHEGDWGGGAATYLVERGTLRPLEVH